MCLTSISSSLIILQKVLQNKLKMRPLQQLSTLCCILLFVLVLVNLGHHRSNAKSGVSRGDNMAGHGDLTETFNIHENGPSLNKESLAEKMFEFGQYLKMLPEKISNVKSLPPKLSVKRTEQLLEEINKKRTELKTAEYQIERLFAETYDEDDQVDLNVFLYNCRTFYLLTDDFIEQLM